jgi:hypothetical protein
LQRTIVTVLVTVSAIDHSRNGRITLVDAVCERSGSVPEIAMTFPDHQARTGRDCDRGLGMVRWICRGRSERSLMPPICEAKVLEANGGDSHKRSRRVTTEHGARASKNDVSGVTMVMGGILKSCDGAAP